VSGGLLYVHKQFKKWKAWQDDAVDEKVKVDKVMLLKKR
jgi:hypothetical protein